METPAPLMDFLLYCELNALVYSAQIEKYKIAW